MGRMQTPLGRVYGLGSARDGTHHFWLIRLTSLALIPLSLWWIAAVIGHAGADYATFTNWVREPITAILLVLTVGVSFYHIALGVQTVIEDYVHHEGGKLALLIAVKFACVLFGVTGIFSVLRIAFGG
jgi:succinate dehydrogenase / fumarate reductase, membrane anchor subunit